MSIMKWIIAFICAGVYFTGFYCVYYRHAPKKDSWNGWIADGLIATFYMVVLPMDVIKDRRKRIKK